ncbi:MAG: hypothetical protein CME62_05345 [Halobacteriovoraceae bacterium]|nr:hypothetical protein [Halobacteriovoraceae bacterium]|tara:strand:- start:30151 stop:30735 length:585 start_codon:yes stop_codon:yes gene_type:complete
MKNLLVLLAIIVQTQAFSSEIVLLGPKATCESKADIKKSQRNGVYRVKSEEIRELENTIEISIAVELLTCAKMGDEYQFIIDNNHMSATYSEMGALSRQMMTVTRTDIKKSIIFFNDDSKILGDIQLDEAYGEQRITVEIMKNAASVNRFPRSISKGEFYIDLALKRMTKYSTPEGVIGPMRHITRGYRIFFDL